MEVDRDADQPSRRATADLLDRAEAGDHAARQRLLSLHRARLRAMMAFRLDPRLAGRVDPSDIVQETLLDAEQKLDGYLIERPLPFYPWLHRLGRERLAQVHRWHLSAGRDAGREQCVAFDLANESVAQLAAMLVDRGSSPTNRLIHNENRQRVRAALERLAENDREVLVMHYLEGMKLTEIAAELGLGPGAVKMRHLRALERMREALESSSDRTES